MYADEGMIKIKHEVLREVARLAFEDRLEEEREFIPERLIPGPRAQFRCCIYKEREIIRQRVRLAEGKAPTENDSGNIIQVIPAACEDCPISSYVVTDNCQNCLGKACVNACPFGACEPGLHRSYIDPAKCKECGKCAQACPYHAIAALKRPCKFACPVDAITYDENGISVIDEEKCIRYFAGGSHADNQLCVKERISGMSGAEQGSADKYPGDEGPVGFGQRAACCLYRTCIQSGTTASRPLKDQ
jgi:ferredoxin hydrogenase large subunit